MMLTKINAFRKWLLCLALISVTIPGFVGYEMVFLGFRLGRFQPFKFCFAFWLALQAIWIFGRFRTQRSMIQFLKSTPVLLLWGSVLLLDLGLFLGLLFEKGGEHGAGILVAMILGQIAAALTILDEDFTAKWVLRGLYGAAGILLSFGFFENFFPHIPWVQNTIALLRDSGGLSYQLGSTLSVSGLAEFSVRAFPIVFVFCDIFWGNLVAAIVFCLLGFLTLEKNALLSLVSMGTAGIILGYCRRYAKVVAAVVAVGIFGILVIKGPEKILGRYVGAWIRSDDYYSQMAKQSMAERKEVLRLGLKTITAKPLFGIGLEGFRVRNANRVPPLEDTSMPHVSHTHNQFLEMAVSGGILAGVAFIMIIGSFAFLAWNSKPRRWVALLYLLGQVFSMVTDSRIYVSWLAITYFWFAALAWRLSPKRETLGNSLI